MRKKLGSGDAEVITVNTFEHIEGSAKTVSSTIKVEKNGLYIVVIGGLEANTSTESVSNFRQIYKTRYHHSSGLSISNNTHYGALAVFIGEAVSDSITISTTNSIRSRMLYYVIKI